LLGRQQIQSLLQGVRRLLLYLIGEILNMEGRILVKVLPQVFLVTHQQPLKGGSLLLAINIEVLFQILILLSPLLTQA
jgi:hypothetical protein